MPTGSEANAPLNSQQKTINGADRKHSLDNGGSKSVSSALYDPTDYIARARVTRPAPPKPSCNPMQFVQIKPCNLYQSAQQQLKRAEEVKKVKEIKREEPEDWQCGTEYLVNLDNWKSSRRKRVEHIIDRVVEVKKLEMEEHDRTRRKSKTFSEMLEERGNARRKLSTLAVYNEDDSNDFSDLGIGTSSASGKSSLSEDYDNHSVMSDNPDAEKQNFDIDNNLNHEDGGTSRDYISSPGYDTSSSTAPASSPDPCEYTYEGAIQDYKTRISRAQCSGYNNGFRNSVSVDSSYSKDSTPERNNDNNNFIPSSSSRRMSSGSKIEDRLMSFEVKSSSNDKQHETSPKKDLPKVDIHKRRELFEKDNSSTPSPPLLDNNVNGGAGQKRFSGDFSSSKSIKERLSNLEKKADDTKKTNRLSGDISSIKDRLQNLEKQNSIVEKTPKIDVPVLSLKDRLSSLQSAVTKEDNINKKPVLLLNENDLESLKKDEISRQQQQQNLQQQQQQQLKQSELTSIAITNATDDENLNSSHEILNIQDEFALDTDREDSGIHTTDVSCSVSQTDEQPELVNEETHHHINEDDLVHGQEPDQDDHHHDLESKQELQQQQQQPEDEDELQIVIPDVVPVYPITPTSQCCSIATNTGELLELNIVEDDDLTATTSTSLILSPEPPIDLEASVSLSLSDSPSASSQTVIYEGGNNNVDTNNHDMLDDSMIPCTEENLSKITVSENFGVASSCCNVNKKDTNNTNQCHLDKNTNIGKVLPSSNTNDVDIFSLFTAKPFNNNPKINEKIDLGKNDDKQKPVCETCIKKDCNDFSDPTNIPTPFMNICCPGNNDKTHNIVLNKNLHLNSEPNTPTTPCTEEMCNKIDIFNLPDPVHIPTPCVNVCLKNGREKDQIEKSVKKSKFGNMNFQSPPTSPIFKTKLSSNNNNNNNNHPKRDDIVLAEVEVITTKLKLIESPPMSPISPRKLLDQPQMQSSQAFTYSSSPNSPTSPKFNSKTHPGSKPKNIFDFLKRNFSPTPDHPENDPDTILVDNSTFYVPTEKPPPPPPPSPPPPPESPEVLIQLTRTVTTQKILEKADSVDSNTTMTSEIDQFLDDGISQLSIEDTHL